MKKFLSMLLVCTLALAAGIALASDEEDMDFVEWLTATMTEGYMGVLEDGATAYFAVGDVDDGAYAVLAFMNTEQTQHASFVGWFVDNEDGTFSVADEYNGLEITIALEAVEGGYLIDIGEAGSGKIAPVDVADVIEAFVIIHNETEAAA